MVRNINTSELSKLKYSKFRFQDQEKSTRWAKILYKKFVRIQLYACTMPNPDSYHIYATLQQIKTVNKNN